MIITVAGEGAVDVAVATRLVENAGHSVLFRIAVRTIEAWLLADTVTFSDFFGVDGAALPEKPDELIDPKRTLVEIIAASSSPPIRKAILPAKGGRDIGPGYTAMLIEYTAHWNIERAKQRSPSLDRCVNAVAALEG